MAGKRKSGEKSGEAGGGAPSGGKAGGGAPSGKRGGAGGGAAACVASLLQRQTDHRRQASIAEITGHDVFIRMEQLPPTAKGSRPPFALAACDAGFQSPEKKYSCASNIWALNLARLNTPGVPILRASIDGLVAEDFPEAGAHPLRCRRERGKRCRRSGRYQSAGRGGIVAAGASLRIIVRGCSGSQKRGRRTAPKVARRSALVPR